MLYQWMEMGLGLLTAALAALGVSVVLHLLRPHPPAPSPSLSASSFNGQMRGALLLLIVTGQGSLLLSSLSLLTGSAFINVDLCLIRLMELLCPLAFVRASLGYFQLRGGGTKGDHRKGNCATLERFRVFLWLYLWAVAAGTSVGALVNPTVFPCIVFRSSSFDVSSTGNEQVFNNEEQRGEHPSAAALSGTGGSLELSEYQRAARVLRSAEKNNVSSGSPQWTEQNLVNHGGPWCVRVRFEVALFCAFYIPLFLCLVLHVWQRSVSSGQVLTASPCPLCEGSRVCNAHHYHGDQGNACQHVLTTHFTASSMNWLQNEQNPSLSNWTGVTNEEVQQTQPSQTRSSEDGSPGLPESVAGFGASSGDAQTLLNEDLPVPGLSEAENIPTAPNQKVILEAKVYSLHQPSSAPVRAEAEGRVVNTTTTAAEETDRRQQAECEVCTMVAPYVPLATLAVLVQHVTLLVAVGWSRSVEVVVLPSCVFYLPVYCALCFTFRAALSHRF